MYDHTCFTERRKTACRDGNYVVFPQFLHTVQIFFHRFRRIFNSRDSVFFSLRSFGLFLIRIQIQNLDPDSNPGFESGSESETH